MEELKHCPFCGKTDSAIVHSDGPGLYVVVCTGRKGGCGARTGISEKRDTAVFWWNHRAAPKGKLFCKRSSQPCPHGYTDWDDCPDCRH